MGRGGYWLGGLLILAAVIGAVAFAGLRLAGLDDTIDGYPKASLPQGSVQLEARDYDVYLDVPGGTGEAGWTLSVRGPAEQEVPLRPTATNFDYGLGGREGSLIGKLRAQGAGRYVIQGTGPPGARVVFGQVGLLGSLAATIGGALAIFLIVGGAGLVLVIVTAVRRRKPQGEPKRWP